MFDALFRGARRAPARAAMLLFCVPLLSACATGRAFPPRPAPETLPPGSPLRSQSLPETDAWLRHYLMTGQFQLALELLDESSKAAPRDRLQRLLQRGVVLHQASRYAESNQAFDEAETEADLRYTRSVSRAAGALVISDRVLEYVPSDAEMAMIPYFRIKNYLASGETDAALVEARKTSHLLGRIAEARENVCASDPFLHYLAGLVYRAGGERNDAVVALRQAEHIFQRCVAPQGFAAPAAVAADLATAATALGLREIADSLRSRYTLGPARAETGAAEVVLLLEHGFVAHRAPRDIHVPIFPEEVEGVESGDAEEVVSATLRVVGRLANTLLEQNQWGAARDEDPTAQIAHALNGAYVLKLAWPAYELEANRAASIRVRIGDTTVAAELMEDVSNRVMRDFHYEKPEILVRAVGRGLGKYLLFREIEKKAEKQGGDLAAFVAARLFNVSANIMEQADTRGWSLLPDQITVIRLTLPPGEHLMGAEVLAADGSVAYVEDWGTIAAKPGETVFLTRRVWGPERGNSGRFSRHGEKQASEITAARSAGGTGEDVAVPASR